MTRSKVLKVGEDTSTCLEGVPMIMRTSSEPLKVDVNAGASAEIVLTSVVVRNSFTGALNEFEVSTFDVDDDEPGLVEEDVLVAVLAG